MDLSIFPMLLLKSLNSILKMLIPCVPSKMMNTATKSWAGNISFIFNRQTEIDIVDRLIEYINEKLSEWYRIIIILINPYDSSNLLGIY